MRHTSPQPCLVRFPSPLKMHRVQIMYSKSELPLIPIIRSWRYPYRHLRRFLKQFEEDPVVSACSQPVAGNF
jgi:hypothetical protein